MIVDSALYVDGRRRPGQFDTGAEDELPHGSFSWTGLFEPTKAEFDQIRRHVDLHDLVVEGALNAPATQAGAVRRCALPGAQAAKYLTARRTSTRRDQVFVTPRAVLHVGTRRPRNWSTCEPV
jgi:hypothetical protein